MKLARLFLFLLAFLAFNDALNAQADGRPGVIGLNSPLFHHRADAGNKFTAMVINSLIEEGKSTQVVIGGRDYGLLRPGMKASYEYGYGDGDDIEINISVCGSVGITDQSNPLPSWMTEDRLSGVALQPEYVLSDPPLKDVKNQVGQIEKILKRYSQKEQRVAELRAWLKNFEVYGAKPRKRETCENPVLRPGKIQAPRNWPLWDEYQQGRKVILSIVRIDNSYRVEGVHYFPQY